MIRVALLPGDGVGPEVVGEARRVLEAVADAGLADLEMEAFPHGADHYLSTGETLGDDAFRRLRDDFDAILLGAVGDPRVPDDEHARDILLGLRFRLDLYVNFRPARLRAPDLSPLKPRRGADGSEAADGPGSGSPPGGGPGHDPPSADFVIFRENTEGMYVQSGGNLREGTPHEVAVSECIATRRGVERLVRAAFLHARRHGLGRVTLADKANAVPHVYGLWRRTFRAVAEEYPELETEERYVDALAMEMVRDPGRFDVVVADNLLGDILSDLAAELVGGMGVAPSANVHPDRHGMYEPVHGSAPELAGTGRANPVAAVLSAALLLRDQGAEEAAVRVEEAVDRALREGVRTPDVGGEATTSEVGGWIARRVRDG